MKLEMNFLPDVWVTCDVCKEKRYTRETLEVKWRGKTIHDILEMPVEEANDFFANQRGIHRILSTLKDRSEEHTSELQSRRNLVCRLLLEKKQ